MRCLPRRADKSVLLSMHIWCKTEKLVDMYLYLVSEWPHTGQDPVTGDQERARAGPGPAMDSRYGQCHILNTQRVPVAWKIYSLMTAIRYGSKLKLFLFNCQVFEIQRGVMETNWQTSTRHFFASKQSTRTGEDGHGQQWFYQFPWSPSSSSFCCPMTWPHLSPNVSGVVKLGQDKISSNESNLSSLDTLLD